MNELEHDSPLKHYLSTQECRIVIAAEELTPLAVNSWRLLREALDSRFFRRYYDRTEMRKAAYVFEMQLRVHPVFKKPESSLNRIVRLCSRCNGGSLNTARENVKEVNAKIKDKLRALMISAVEPVAPPAATIDEEVHSQFSVDLWGAFSPRPQPTQVQNQLTNRVDDEIRR